LFVGSASSTPSKIVAVGDTLSDGRILQSLTFNEAALNASGQVAFFGTTNGGGSGIYVGSGGTTPTKVAATGDSGPGGSTFSGFAEPGFNDSGEVVFVAALSGGPGGGAFIGSTSSSPVALALNGDPAPLGGNYSITTARPDAVINNHHDVAVRANLSGGTSDSGYFIRRGPSGSVTTLVLQGQAAPGVTGGTFATITPGLNGLLGEQFQLASSGDFAFQNNTVAPGGGKVGSWHVKTDNTVEEILVRGTVAPEFGGGTAIITTVSTGWNSGGRYASWARITGGTFTDGIFLFVPVVSANTPAGTSVPVTVTDSTTGTVPLSLNFANVSTAGNTSLTTSSGGPAIPTAFSIGDPPVFYNIESTATFNGSIGVCIDFSNVTFPPGADLRLLHYENGNWVDVTTSGPSGNIICGSVTSLSPFTVAQNLNLVNALAPANVWLGLKNSDDVGTKFDLLAEVFKDGNLIGTGQINSVPGGSSGFNNASLRTIPLSLNTASSCCGGGTLSIRISVRVAADSGHRSGTARLWYNDAQANSNFGATIGTSPRNYYLLNVPALATSVGPGPKKTIDVKVDRPVGGNPFKAFGTWVIAIP
jgi:hypothetical protein